MAPVTRVIPEESIELTGLLGDGPVSFSISDSKNLKKKKNRLEVMKRHEKSHTSIARKEKERPTFAGEGGPLKKYNVFINLPKSQPCFPASANMASLNVFRL